MKRFIRLAALAAALAACGTAGPTIAPKTAARDAEEVTHLLPAISLRLERCEFVEVCRTLLDACQSRNPERCPLVNVMAPDQVRTERSWTTSRPAGSP